VSTRAGRPVPDDEIRADGTVARASEIWTLNFIPDDLDVNGIDLARAEEVIGPSLAEEDHFIARWIAS
jgi:hypothetical protein